VGGGFLFLYLKKSEISKIYYRVKHFQKYTQFTER